MDGRIARAFAGRKVFLTGHTGFKGAWLSLWLAEMGAEVTGYALPPATQPNLYEAAQIDQRINGIEGDIRDYETMRDALIAAQPEIVLHLAAQAIVPTSYREPRETFDSNVMGTVNLLEAVRHCPSVKACVVVSSDKCYENLEIQKRYREDDPMGGYDPYSASKGCTELVVSSYRRSFFLDDNAPPLGSARAGNVIGGGDWADNRLIPDFVRALEQQQTLVLRNPKAVRPWQHVLEPLSGYLWLATRLLENGQTHADGWNFGPDDDANLEVEALVQQALGIWGEGSYEVQSDGHPHEAQLLQLDISKAKQALGWSPVFSAEAAIEATLRWYRRYFDGARAADLQAICVEDIRRYAAQMRYDHEAAQ